MNRGSVILTAVIIYLGVCIGVGLWAMRRTKSSNDFFMGGRNLGPLVIGFAAFSSTLSGFGFVGGPGLVYRMGMSSIWMVVVSAISIAIGFSVVAKRARLLAQLGDCISLPDVAYLRFRSNLVRGLLAVVVLLGVLGYLATQILAMSVVLQEVLRDANFFPDISLGMAVTVSTSVLLFYTVTGGIIASVYTDLIQGIIMVVAAVLVFGTILTTFDGGMAEISSIIAADDAQAMGPWGTIGVFGAMSWILVFSLGGAGQPHVVTKYMMIKEVRGLRTVIPVMAGAYMLAALLWIGLGLAMRALVLSGRHDVLAAPDMAAAAFLQGFTNPVLAGVVFAALLAAIMSTADSFLNVGTAAIVHDIPNALIGRAVKNELLWARATTVGLSVFAAIIAVYSGELVALLGAFGWGTFAAAFVPVLAIGLNWKRATPRAAVVAIVASLAINFGTRVAGVSAPYSTDMGAVALVVSMFLFIVVSLMDKPATIDPDVGLVMEL